ncbi:MAG TPA: sigma-54 dependent transcriptional regulator [Desulfatiglandales bacterium]|nr:sigma-54 dependent transcriptional regulator [Desulfatiglandales bacterium]
MNRLTLLYEVLDQVSDCIAIFDDNQQVEYANTEFKKLYSPLQHAHNKNQFQELQDFVLRFQKSKKRFISENFLDQFIGREIKAFAFSLNDKSTRKKFNLVLVKTGNQSGVPESFFAKDLLKCYINEQRLISEPLAPEFQILIGEAPNFRLVLHNAQRAASTDLPIIIRGESGTGKEILSKTIHNISHRAQGPFVDINCAALPENLIESELFGYERGAFTGAQTKGKLGLFEKANGGTMFLDEICDASLSTQAKILKVVEEKKFRRIGGSENRKVDVRIISATNKDLENMMSKGLFRDDLFYRLNTLSITLPPLRDRSRDIRLLANHFLNEQTKGQEKSITFSEEALKALESYFWPGNVRELKAVVDYAVTMNDEEEISRHSLPGFVFSKKFDTITDQLLSPHIISIQKKIPLLSIITKEIECNLIRFAIQQSRSKSEAIRILGISRRAFYYKLKEYNL